MVCAEFTLRNARCAISDFAARFLWLNPPVCHGHIPATGSAPSAFTSDQAGRPQVYKVSVGGGTPQRISWEGSQNQDADVSSDGKFMRHSER